MREEENIGFAWRRFLSLEIENRRKGKLNSCHFALTSYHFEPFYSLPLPLPRQRKIEISTGLLSFSEKRKPALLNSSISSPFPGGIYPHFTAV